MKRKTIAGLLLVMLFLAVLPASRHYAGTTEITAMIGDDTGKSDINREQTAQDTEEKIGVIVKDTLYFLRLVPAPELNDPMGIPGPKIDDPIEINPDQVVPKTIPGEK